MKFEMPHKKSRRCVWVVLCVCLLLGLTGVLLHYQFGKHEEENFQHQEEISWTKNEDGTYTFINNMGTESSQYAWYVLDENDEVIYKTKYSSSPEFTYDLKENRDLAIKGFVRNGNETEYDQTSIKIYATDVLVGNWQ